MKGDSTDALDADRNAIQRLCTRNGDFWTSGKASALRWLAEWKRISSVVTHGGPGDRIQIKFGGAQALQFNEGSISRMTNPGAQDVHDG